MQKEKGMSTTLRKTEVTRVMARQLRSRSLRLTSQRPRVKRTRPTREKVAFWRARTPAHSSLTSAPAVVKIDPTRGVRNWYKTQ